MLRFAIYALIFGLIYFGLRRVIKDWRDRFREIDKTAHERDLRERERPDVIDLEPDQDGVFRPGSKRKDDKTRK